MSLPTRLIKVDPTDPDPKVIAEAAALLQSGRLVAFPTETVYGLGAIATDPEAVAEIFKAKGRPSANPLIVHAADVASALPAISEWPSAAAILAEAFWPGPLTLVLPRSAKIPDVVTAGGPTVGVRVPDHPVAQQLLRHTSSLIAAPSANRSTGISATSAEHVFKDLGGKLEIILDAGPSRVGLESTVLDLTSTPPRLLRPGAITATQIENLLGIQIAKPAFLCASDEPKETETFSSPGQMSVHYAPRTPLVLLDPGRSKALSENNPARFGLLVCGTFAPAEFETAFYRRDWTHPEQAARELYESLHECDASSLDAIFVVAPPLDEDWRAIRDRLWRASRRWAREGNAPSSK